MAFLVSHKGITLFAWGEWWHSAGMKKILRGVNLGGWLVLEKWITPSLFDGYKAQDEWSFSTELGANAEKVLNEHRSTYVTEQDFAWLAEHGINAVRIPVGHGIFGDAPPFIGAIDYLDFAVESAQKHGLQVVIDLHTAPESQNGWDHSGKAGKIGWDKNPRNSEQTLNVLEKLTARYKNHPNLAGIEVLNEPHWTVNKDVLKNYYRRAYELIRKQGYEGRIIMSDAFDPGYWSTFIHDEGFANVVLDVHLYQCFDLKDKMLSLEGHLRKTRNEWAELLARLQEKVPVIIGEWSLGLEPIALKLHSAEKMKRAYTEYGAAELEVFEQTSGWFFWTYKTEDRIDWSFQECVKEGILPNKF